MKKFELIFFTLFFMDIFLLPVHGAQEEGSLTIHLDDPGAQAALYIYDSQSCTVEDVNQNACQPVFERTADASGKIIFDHLAPASYIVKQTAHSSGQNAFESHIVIIPGQEPYDVAEYPKTEKIVQPPDIPSAVTPEGDQLPYTGTSQWIAQILAAFGIGCILSGTWIRKHDEKH